MDIIDVDIAQESQNRYLTYALSVVSSRALPDVRDGLKPVQRRILYAMVSQLNLTPERYHRKSAAVVGEVLARFHPHGDSACYEAMVRMAQDFSLRYPLVDGQGNFGSLDGDAAAAYRYTEARLTAFAMEVIGDIGEETVSERDNFDQTTREPVVLPARVPNLLVNGASGIAVGMATAIPPHNLKEVVKALLILLEDEEAPEAKLLSAVKAPDFPTGCLVLNSPKELREVYRTGKGAIRMRGAHKLEESSRGKDLIVITSIPYAIDKSALVEKIADFIISKKVPQLVDIRDESTDEVRIVLELAPGADPEKALAFLYKNTTLQQNFNVNMTALVPTANPLSARPALLSLRDMLQQFLTFRVDVVRKKLLFEKGKLDERIHLLEGLVRIFDALDEVIRIVRKSDGRADAAAKLQARFKLTEPQALFIVDLRIYQLSKTSIEEITGELREKEARVAEIVKILGSKKALHGVVSKDLERISDRFGDSRRSPIVSDFEEPEFDKEEYVQHELAFVVVSRDGWLKRIRTTNDPQTTRLREGDALSFVAKADTRDTLVIFSNQGNMYTTPVFDVTSTSGFGEPVQKMFRFADGEQIVSCMVLTREQMEKPESVKQDLLLFSAAGYGFLIDYTQLQSTKKSGKRLMRLSNGDTMQGVVPIVKDSVLLVSEQGYAVYFLTSEIPKLTGAGKGVILTRLPGDDRLVVAASVDKKSTVRVDVAQGSAKEIKVAELTFMGRAKRGLKLVKRGLPVRGLAAAPQDLFEA
ncbi:MAG: DNA topoisomerase IV subunit A [Bdellovibrionota bacterium]